MDNVGEVKPYFLFLTSFFFFCLSVPGFSFTFSMFVYWGVCVCVFFGGVVVQAWRKLVQVVGEKGWTGEETLVRCVSLP